MLNEKEEKEEAQKIDINATSVYLSKADTLRGLKTMTFIPKK